MRDLERFGIDQDAYERAAAETDELLTRRAAGAQLKYATKENALVRSPNDLVYKTIEDARPIAEPQLANADRDDQWNEWCDRRIAAALLKFADLMGEESAAIENRLGAEIAELRRELRNRNQVQPKGSRLHAIR